MVVARGASSSPRFCAFALMGLLSRPGLLRVSAGDPVQALEAKLSGRESQLRLVASKGTGAGSYAAREFFSGQGALLGVSGCQSSLGAQFGQCTSTPSAECAPQL